jgi:PAS domain S-box-containing protein
MNGLKLMRRVIVSRAPNQNVQPGYGKSLEPHRKRSALKLVNQSKRSTVHNPVDEVLKALTNVSTSRLAVLDESGNVLCASKGWRSFENTLRNIGNQSDSKHYFEDCVGMASSSEKGQNSTLSDDIQRLLLGSQTEFQKQYCCGGDVESSPFVINGKRLNVRDCALRILLTLDDATSQNDVRRKGEFPLTQLLETTKTIVWEADAESWRFNYVSEQAEKILGYPIAEWYQEDFLASHISPEDKHRIICQRHSQLERQYNLTFRMVAADGSIIWLHNLVLVTFEGRKPKQISGFMVDISEQRRAEESLRELGGRLIAAQEKERSRIACELHDDFNQRLALLSIELEQLGKKIPKEFDLRQSCQAIQKQTREISADLHRLSYRLHPTKLDHLGLEAAVASLCEEFSDSSNLKIRFQEHGFPATLPKDVALCVFRIAQEALRNCIKHSHARHAQVVLSRTTGAVRLSVSDDGCGFDMTSEKRESGLGLISMRERLRLVGGEIQIKSRPHCGTRIEVSVPLSCDLLFVI